MAGLTLSLAAAVPWLLAAMLPVWGLRELHLKRRRRSMRGFSRLNEEAIAAESAPDLLVRLNNVLPNILKASRAGLYVYNRGTKALDVIAPAGETLPPVDLSAPPEGVAEGAVECFRQRNSLSIPNARGSRIFTDGDAANLPRSIFFAPMFFQNELLGVLELRFEERRKKLSAEERTALQRLANQAAIALRLQEQIAVRNRLFGAGKVAVESHPNGEYQPEHAAAGQQPYAYAGRRRLTVLLIEPDAQARGEILDLLSRLGDRVVPVSSGDEAADLANRLRFDLVLCSAGLRGLRWPELFERIGNSAGSFVLLAQPHDLETGGLLDPAEGNVLAKPVDRVRLGKVCDAAALRAANLSA